jgi:nucleotide-binding universal stress UspA family protein
MTYRTILVSLNEITRLPQLIAAAITVATAQGSKGRSSHVSGLYVVPAVQIYPAMGMDAPVQIFDGNHAYFVENKKKVVDAFTDAMTRAGLPFDCQAVESNLPAIGQDVLEHARCADLTIVSATDETQPSGVEPDFVDQLVMAAGRPVLVLPRRGKGLTQIDNVILGWDGSREAARAAFDALPLLQAASKVRMVTVDPQKEFGSNRGMVGADIAETMARQGVKVTAEPYTTNGMNSGQALLQCVADDGAGLIVMGAYGHSRLREYIFGGTTQHVLSKHEVPVLMSH